MALEAAAQLCIGPYLPDYDAHPDYDLAHHAEHWAGFQRQVLHRLVRLCLRFSTLDFVTLARRTLDRLLNLPDTSYINCLLATEFYEHVRDRLMADYYRTRARLLLDE